MKYFILILIAALILFLGISIILDALPVAEGIIDLYTYTYNSEDNIWESVYNGQFNSNQNINKVLTDPNIPQIGIGDLIIAIHGCAIYYQIKESWENEIDIIFPENHLHFSTLDWINRPISDIELSLSCFIPPLGEYMKFATIKPDSEGEIHLKHINPDYQYKINIIGTNIHEKTFYFSSLDDFENYLGTDAKAIYLVRKNSIFGSFYYERTMHRPTLGYVELGVFNHSDSVKIIESRSFTHNRFLFIVNEKMNSERFCLRAKDHLSGNTSDYDLFVSEEPYDIYFDEKFGIFGRVANSNMDFPVEINAHIHYIYEQRNQDYPISTNKKSFEWYQTDHNGYFMIPIYYILGNWERLADSIESEICFVHLTLRAPSSDNFLSYRHEFTEKELGNLKKGPSFIDIGDIQFSEGIEVFGQVLDIKGNPVPNVDVFLSYRGSIWSWQNLFGFPEDVYEYTLSLEKQHGIHSLTNNKGEFIFSKEIGIIFGDYDITLFNKDFVLTMHPDIKLNKNKNNLGILEIDDGNELIIYIYHNEEMSDFSAKLVPFRNFPKNMILRSAEEGLLVYYNKKLLPNIKYEVKLYRSDSLIYEQIIEFEEKNTSKTLEVFF